MKAWTQELKQLIKSEFQYDPLTGVIKRVCKRGVKKDKTITGSKDRNGYRTVGITCEGEYWQIKLHRICWFLGTGQEETFVSFKEGQDDFRLSNLRAYEKVSVLKKLEVKEQAPDYGLIYGDISAWDRARREAEGIG